MGLGALGRRGTRHRFWVAFVLLLAAPLGGCLAPAPPPAAPDGTDDAAGGVDATYGRGPGDPVRNTGNGSTGTGGSGSTSGNASATNTTAEDGNATARTYADDPWAGEAEPEWPPLAQAKVRPGVQIVIGPSQCTSNFLFRDVWEGTLYLGTAAHCVQGAQPGQSVSIRDAQGQLATRGSVAYSSWWSIGFTPAPGLGDDVHPHDFALIRIPDEDRHLVHPAVLHYGGPTALAEWGLVAPLDRVIVHGASGMRPAGPLDEQEGYVLDKRSANTPEGRGHSVLTHVIAPPLPGDSGSGLMTKEGHAVGALSAIYAGVPYGAWWEYSSIPHALTHLRAEGWDLRLATAPLAGTGLLP